MDNKGSVIKLGWGYFTEFNGNPTGSFTRAKTDIPITVIGDAYANNRSAVYAKLPDGKTAFVDKRSIIGG